MTKVIIKETKRCDTRALVKTFTETDVETDTLYHVQAVNDVAVAFSKALLEQVSQHDYTKLGTYLPMFTRALKTGFVNDEFKKLNWWQLHYTSERHHLNDRCPEDVNLIDVIEMLIDCVCAGKARTGEVYAINISDEILQKAVFNTTEMLKENVVVKKD